MKNHELGFKPLVTKICAAVALVSLAGCGGAGGSGSSSSSAALSSAALSSVAPSSVAESSSSIAISSTAPSSVAQSSDSIVVTPSSAAESSSSVAPSSVAASSSSVALSSTAASSSAPATPHWKLVWSDEFDGTAIDTSKWGFEQNCWGGGNNEQQCYTDRPVNSFVADGVLNIVAIKEQFSGSNQPEGGGGTATLPYTSARLRTKGIQEWTFGRFEIKAKLPAGQGTWPAIWMLPTDSPYGTWASSGEIDIMEAVNLKTVPLGGGAAESKVYGTLHYGRNWPANKQSGAFYTLPDGANPADGFHEYALEWEEGEIRWYVDGVHFATQRDTGWYGQYMQGGVLTDAPVGAPFDHNSKFHLLLNLAVGGSWAGNVNNTGVDESVFPQTMQVDYVRVYKCNGAPAATGRGCATINPDAIVVPGNTRPIIGAVDLDGPPLFVMYGDELASGLKFNYYMGDPEQHVNYSEVAEAGRGTVFNMVKTGVNGNAYFEVNGDPADLTNWSTDSELVFDVKVNSKAVGANLVVKIDSGWPNVSDYTVPVDVDGVWKEIRITLADLIDNRNTMNGGTGVANLASIKNTFVIDSTGAIDVSFDNVRIVGSASTEFAPLPLYTIYDNAANANLSVQKWDNNSGQVQFAEVDAEPEHGKVLNIAKTGSTGSAFFTVNTAPTSANFSKWSAKGELVFDYRVNTKAAGVKLLVKMDSGWPSVSDVEVNSDADGVWKTYRIDVATLIARGNSIQQPNSANIAGLLNVFVVEPSGVMNLDVDNIRLVIKEDEEEPEPTEDMDIFVGGLDAAWGNPGFGVWQADGQVITIDATVNDPDKGTVTQVAFTPVGMGTFFIQGPFKDLSAFASGNLVFDLKVVSNTGNTNGFLVKADCGYPCTGAEVPVALPGDNDWHTITVPIADINKGGFDITKVNTPFSLWPVFGQQNVTFQVANVRWELAD